MSNWPCARIVINNGTRQPEMIIGKDVDGVLDPERVYEIRNVAGNLMIEDVGKRVPVAEQMNLFGASMRNTVDHIIALGVLPNMLITVEEYAQEKSRHDAASKDPS